MPALWNVNLVLSLQVSTSDCDWTKVRWGFIPVWTFLQQTPLHDAQSPNSGCALWEWLLNHSEGLWEHPAFRVLCSWHPAMATVFPQGLSQWFRLLWNGSTNKSYTPLEQKLCCFSDSFISSIFQRLPLQSNTRLLIQLTSKLYTILPTKIVCNKLHSLVELNKSKPWSEMTC